MKYDKIGELEGERFGGAMRGGELLLRGVRGGGGDVGEPEESEDETETERRRQLGAILIGMGLECFTESWLLFFGGEDMIVCYSWR
jgi:hypothetical protein